MIKGVNIAPTKESPSLKEVFDKEVVTQKIASHKKASPLNAFKSEKPLSKVSNLSEASDANTHTTVLLDEAVQALAIKPDGIYVDGTFGRGGHSKKILAALGAKGRLIAFDRDLSAIESSKAIEDARFSMVHSHFAGMQNELADLGIGKVDGILLDLGISSPQVDVAERGFSFRFDAPLDMRMDQSRGQTVADYLAIATEQHLAEVIKNYGEERFAKQIARAIITERNDGRAITTTGQLTKVVAGAVTRFEPGQNPATRTFQALRIHVNQELEELSLTLPQALATLKPSARLVVISFHSLEDRIVKNFMRAAARPMLPDRLPVKARDLPAPKLQLIGRPVRPALEEITANPRARSAVMRVAEKPGVTPA